MLKPTGVGRDNFMAHISPDSRLGGKELIGVDQAAMEAKQRLKAMDRENGPYGLGDYESRRHDWEAVDKVDRRKNRGGATFGNEDTMGCD